MPFLGVCQKKGIILGGGPVSPVHCSVKAEIPLVRRSPRQAGRQAGLGVVGGA